MRTVRPLSLNPAWLLAPAAFLAFALVVPLWHVLRAVSLESVAWAAGIPPWSTFVRERLLVDLEQAGISVLVAFAAAVPLTLLHRRSIPGGRFLLGLHAAPFVLPVFVIVYGLQGTIGPAGLGWQWTPLAAIVVANAYYNYGFAARLLSSLLERRPTQLEDVARTLGASPWQTTRRITWPLLGPSFLGIVLLVALFCLGSFGVVLLLGESQVSTLETLLYQNLQGAFPAEDHAAILGILQLVLNVLLLSSVLMLAGRNVRLGTARVSRRPARPWHIALAWGLGVIAVVPIVSVLVGGFRVQGHWSLEPWRSLVDASHPSHLAGFDLGHALGRSLLYAGGAVALSLVLVLLLAYAGRRLQSGRRLAEALATLPLGTSFILTGFGLLLAYGAGGIVDLRGQPILVIAAHALVVTPLFARVVLPAIAQIDLRLEQQAALLGASAGQAWLRAHVPLLRRPVIVASSLGAALSMADYGSGLLLTRSDTAGLAVWIGAHDRAFDLFAHSQAVALAGFLCVLSVALYAIADRAGGPL